MPKRLPPRNTSFQAPEPGPVAGVDNLPIPSGTNASAKRQAELASEATPGAMNQKNGYRECDGDNPAVSPNVSFANGPDVRSYGSSPKSDPSPAMPGA